MNQDPQIRHLNCFLFFLPAQIFCLHSKFCLESFHYNLDKDFTTFCHSKSKKNTDSHKCNNSSSPFGRLQKLSLNNFQSETFNYAWATLWLKTFQFIDQIDCLIFLNCSLIFFAKKTYFWWWSFSYPNENYFLAKLKYVHQMSKMVTLNWAISNNDFSVVLQSREYQNLCNFFRIFLKG